MSGFNRQAHWQQVYTEKGENQVSWFQERPTVSLELIEAVGVKPSSAIIDIGGGASRLVDALVEKGFRDLSVLDLSEKRGFRRQDASWPRRGDGQMDRR